MDLKGKSAVITGSNSGIGLGIAEAMAAAGARVVLNCKGCENAKPKACNKNDDCPSNECNAGFCVVNACAEHIYIGSNQKPCQTDDDCGGQLNSCDTGIQDPQGRGRCLVEIEPTGSYELATSTYLAGGGSGFVVLKKNTTQLDTKIQQRDALIDWVRGGKPCGWRAENKTKDGLRPCGVDSDCSALGTGYVCACPENVTSASDGSCTSQGSCGDNGRCVLDGCRQDVADFYRETCANPQSAKAIASCASSVDFCQLGGEQCKFLACIDRNLGSFADGRVLMVGR